VLLRAAVGLVDASRAVPDAGAGGEGEGGGEATSDEELLLGSPGD